MNKRALICGISGQDGAYLAKHLLGLGYTVCGTSRDAQVAGFSNLKRLGIHDQVQYDTMALNDFRSVLTVLKKFEPEEVYNLAGQTSVGLSFEQPVETFDSIVTGTLNLLEAIRFSNSQIKFYNAASSECFGDIGTEMATELTPFRPRSPYAVAKAAAFWQVANYREAYNLFACSGILFNHDSPLRPKRFVTQKIIDAVCAISQGHAQKLHLGNISIIRDWGWAPDYVEAMHLMLQQTVPEDFVIATGESHSLSQFIETAFLKLGLNWQDYVEVDNTLFRPTDLAVSKANPQKADEQLGWKARHRMRQVVDLMIEEALKPSK
ncbi:MAG: GDP-mannose 4,6-dehydratase [Spirochaetales bacterium]|nr:GDP-mannose 4,6-dehydratase [Spirochaetales bacterium]